MLPTALPQTGQYTVTPDILRVFGPNGDLPGALESFQAGMAIDERLAKADPTNAVGQRDLSVSHSKIGDVLHGQGDLSGALENYRAAMVIRERLAEADPTNRYLARRAHPM